ncbi:MAG: PEP-CTERM sorting domain-containing protein [Planctomycetota bacterium]
MNKSLVAIAIAGFAASASAQNLLLNPGFEDGSGTDIDNWEQIQGPSGGAVRDSAMPFDGDFNARMFYDQINNPATAAPNFIQQVSVANTLDNTVNYDFSFFAKLETTDLVGLNVFAQLQWLDQDGSNGGGVQGEEFFGLIGEGITTDRQLFSFNDLDAPDGADSFLVRFQASQGPIDGIANGLNIDNASLTVVPAPASAALLGLGGLAAARRRR